MATVFRHQVPLISVEKIRFSGSILNALSHHPLSPVPSHIVDGRLFEIRLPVPLNTTELCSIRCSVQTQSHCFFFHLNFTVPEISKESELLFFDNCYGLQTAARVFRKHVVVVVCAVRDTVSTAALVWPSGVVDVMLSFFTPSVII